MTLLINVKGKVQGVAFRYSAMHFAKTINITGYAKNLADSSVEIVAQGSEDNIQKFVIWCHQGPTRARVEKVEWTEIDETKHFSGFSIR